MKQFFVLLPVLLVVISHSRRARGERNDDTSWETKQHKRHIEGLEEEIQVEKREDPSATDKLEQFTKDICLHLMMTQFAMEERVRSEGGSGIKQMRVNKCGTRPYHCPHFAGSKVAAIHDHANNVRTVGLGEMITVLNGVESRTRHNDYPLMMPHRNSSNYHEVEEIPYPDVPLEVTSKPTLEEQITELREWFKAFAEQNYTVRDYRNYFKPVLSYLECSWTVTNETIEEGFSSDRHEFNALTWEEMFGKIRFTSETGRKDSFENLAYFPSKILECENGTVKFAQWNCRILSHPLERDVQLKELRPVDDLVARFAKGLTMEEYVASRAARFQVSDLPPTLEAMDTDLDSLIDKLMAEVPGPDNYQGNITDDVMGTAYPIDKDNDQPLNLAFYNRYYRDKQKGAMGLTTRHRGFSDSMLYVALTTQEKVPEVSFKSCKGKKKNDVCDFHSQRPVYAVPLELIFLTPLHTWNPYNLTYRGDAKSEEGKVVKGPNANGEERNGDTTDPDLAYNGTNSKYYYNTPEEFYASDEGEGDPADTVQAVAGVLDNQEIIRKVKASGTRIHLPEIPGIPGRIRQRYPIMPVVAEGSAVWKQVSAIEDAVMQMMNYLQLYKTVPPIEDRFTFYDDNQTIYTFYTSPSENASYVEHFHRMYITGAQMKNILAGEKIEMYTEIAENHKHWVKIGYQSTQKKYKYYDCDNLNKCIDQHKSEITVERVDK